MSNGIKGNQIDGDLSVGRNVSMGGEFLSQGHGRVKGNLKVDGWLFANNVKVANKGFFTTVEELEAAYPKPMKGWWAVVGTSVPGQIYAEKDGKWVATGGTGGEVDPLLEAVEMFDVTEIGGRSHKLTKMGQAICPVTTTTAVVDPNLQAPVSDMIDVVNVSVLFPKSGVAGSDKFTFEEAIRYVPVAYRRRAIKCAFYGTDGKSYVYEYQGGVYTDKANWLRVDGKAVNEQKLAVEGVKTELTTFKQSVDKQVIDNANKVNEANAISRAVNQKVSGGINYDDLSLSARQIIESKGGGVINNQADEEDITVVEGKLKEADRAFNPAAHSGKGRKILRKNILKGNNVLSQDMILLPDTIYVIRYDFSLDGMEVRIPDNSILCFEGGKIMNGTIDFNNCEISGNHVTLFVNIKHKGSPRNTALIAEWFNINTSNFDNSDYLQQVVESQGNVLGYFKTIKFSSGVYVFRKEIRLNGVILEGAYPCYNMDFRHYTAARYGYLHTIFQYIPSDYGKSIDYTYVKSTDELNNEKEIVFLKSQTPVNSGHCGGFEVRNINFVCGDNPKNQTMPNKSENVTCIECSNTVTIKECIIRCFNTAIRKYASQYTIVDGLILIGCVNGIYLKHQTGDPLDTTFYINRLSCSFVDIVINTIPTSTFYQANICSDIRMTDVVIQACRIFIMNYDRHLASVSIHNLYTEGNTNPEGVFLIQYILSKHQTSIGATIIPNLYVYGAYCVDGHELVYAEEGNIQLFGGIYYLKDHSFRFANKHLDFLNGSVSFRILGSTLTYDGTGSFLDIDNLDERSKNKIWIQADDSRNGGTRFNPHLKSLRLGNEWEGSMLKQDGDFLKLLSYHKNELSNFSSIDNKNQILLLSDNEQYRNPGIKSGVHMSVADLATSIDGIAKMSSNDFKANILSLTSNVGNILPAVFSPNGKTVTCTMMQPVWAKGENEIKSLFYPVSSYLKGIIAFNETKNELNTQGFGANRYKVGLVPHGAEPFSFKDLTGLPNGYIYYSNDHISVLNVAGTPSVLCIRITSLASADGTVILKLPGKEFKVEVRKSDDIVRLYKRIAGTIVHANYHAYYDTNQQCVKIIAECTDFNELDNVDESNIVVSATGLTLELAHESASKPGAWKKIPCIIRSSSRPNNAGINGVVHCNSGTHAVSWYDNGIWYDMLGNPAEALTTGTTGQRPIGVKAGFAFKDTTIGKWVFWAGSRWELADGTQA